LLNKSLIPFSIIIILVLFATGSFAGGPVKTTNLVTIYGLEKFNITNANLPEAKALGEGPNTAAVRALAFAPDEAGLKDSFSNKVQIELGFEKFQLSGSGFNANLDYSKSLGVFDHFTFHPLGKCWDMWITLGVKNTFFTDLNGLVPNKANLTNVEVSLGQNFHFNSFSFGPILQFDKTLSSVTSPDILEVKKNSFLTGLNFNIRNDVNPFFALDFFLQGLIQIAGNPDTYSNGFIQERYKFSSGILFDIKSESRKKYFSGIIIKNESTKFSNGSRSPSNAKENKTSIVLPLGMRFDFL
jgi:hypothetical protein